MTKPLNIGMIGYGFMGRAHSNAYRQVNTFLRHRTQARPQGRFVPAMRITPRPSPSSGATNRSKPTGGS